MVYNVRDIIGCIDNGFNRTKYGGTSMGSVERIKNVAQRVKRLAMTMVIKWWLSSLP